MEQHSEAWRALADRVIQATRDALDLPESTPVTVETNLVDDLGAASIDIIAFQILLDDELGMELDNDQIPSVPTIANITDTLAAMIDPS